TPTLACTINMSDTTHPLPHGAEILLASGPLDGNTLPPDTAAWHQS
ncbi:MAG: DUF3459 domain-containing protein, partial [Actinomycetes bacterium]